MSVFKNDTTFLKYNTRFKVEKEKNSWKNE